MSIGSTLKKFNPADMSEEDVIALATGREKLLATMLEEMKPCVKSKISQHYVLFGPRGIGKSFFIRLLNIHHDQAKEFNESIFIQFPEEMDNIRYVADVMDKISNKLEGGYYVDTKPRWEMNEYMWSESKKRLTSALKKIKLKDKQHVFIGIENLQDFIPKLNDIENGRMREFLSDFYQITLIGSSLRPDLDNDYNKKLFQVFKKIDVEPWKEDDYMQFYQKKANLSSNRVEQQRQLSISENKIKAIVTFTGGSPRLGVILSSLVLDQKIIETAVLLDNIIDDLTAYYQDLIRDIPLKSKVLFDMLIRIGENVTQSELAKAFEPSLEQKTIARSFNWLLDNYYVVYKKQSKGNTKHYFIRDRLFVLYYQKRQVFADQLTSFVGVFVDFLTEYLSLKEWKAQIRKIDLLHPISRSIMLCYSEKRGLKINENTENEIIQSSIVSDIEGEYSKSNKDNTANSKNTNINDEFLRKVIVGANQSYHKGNFEKAIELYKKAIELNKQYSLAYNGLGAALHKKGDLPNAIKQYNNAIQLHPNEAIYNFNLGIALYEKGDIQETKIHFRNAIELDPRFTQAYYNLGLIYYNQGNWKYSENCVVKALEVTPRDQSLVNRLLELYLIQSKWEAVVQFDKELPDGMSKDKLIGRVLGETINNKHIQPFLLFKQTLDFIQSSHPDWLVGFVISLTMHLFNSDDKNILSSFIDELEKEEKNNPFINIIIECWHYLQNPENQDISKLHPDARTVINKILELENPE